MPDQHGYLLPQERQLLLRQYAPVLVLFPEHKKQAPYPDDGDAIYTLRSSYHPRAVEFFLEHARVRYPRRVWLRNLMLRFRPHSYREEKEQAQQSITRDELQAAVQTWADDPHYAGLGDAELRAAVMKRLVQHNLAQRIDGFDLPVSRGHNVRQWKKYFEFLKKSSPEGRRVVVYGRVVQGLAPLGHAQISPQSKVAQVSRYGPYDVSQTRVALQYWCQYYYDDWANRHEGDWEGLSILLEVDARLIEQDRPLEADELLSGVMPQDAGYAAHEDGYRRHWDDVQKTREGRPIVYVARGSSASYFAWKLDGYPTSARVGFVERLLALPGMLLRGRRFLGRRWDGEFRARFTGRDPKNTDWVAADPESYDRLDEAGITPRERAIPPSCRGVRRVPCFDPEAGLDANSYHLETEHLFWLEMVQEFGVQWGEDSWLPGMKGPSGRSQSRRAKEHRLIHNLAQVEQAAEKALEQLRETYFTPAHAIPELASILHPLRPETLQAHGHFPEYTRSYVYAMWAGILRDHPEAWPGGPGWRARWRFGRQYTPGPLLVREDPMYHLKALLAQVRRTRYEIQSDGSKWDNPFAWVHYTCRADTFYYGIARRLIPKRLDVNYLDCVDEDLSAL